MPICKYFLQGKCRYGNNCAFEHVSDGFSRQSNSPGRRFANNDQIPTPEQVIKHDLIDALPTWPLSCYGLNLTWETGSNLMTGDFSPEELRVEAYSQSRSFGNIENYKATLQTLVFQKAAQRQEHASNLSLAVNKARTPHQTLGRSNSSDAFAPNHQPIMSQIPPALPPSHSSQQAYPPYSPHPSQQPEPQQQLPSSLQLSSLPPTGPLARSFPSQPPAMSSSNSSLSQEPFRLHPSDGSTPSIYQFGGIPELPPPAPHN